MKVFFNALDGRSIGLEIAPSVILAPGVAATHVKILANAPPGAGARSVALLQELLLYGRWGEVPIAFYVEKLLFRGFGNNLAVPYCLHLLAPYV